MTPAQLQILKTEILGDPRAYGYAGQSDSQIADLLNLVRAGITIRRRDIPPQELLEAIDNRDFIASPNTALCSWFESVSQLRSVRLIYDDGTNTRVMGNLRRLLNDTQGSQTRLNAIALRNGSRAEELLGTDVTVQHPDVAAARQV